MPINANQQNGAADNARVMIVDDSPATLHSLIMLLHHFGFEVWGFLDEEEAIAEVREYAPDVLICDVHVEEASDPADLPSERIKGIRTASAIQRQRPQCEVIVMSGNMNPSVISQHAKKMGVNITVMPKPADPAALLNEIRRSKAA